MRLQAHSETSLRCTCLLSLHFSNAFKLHERVEKKSALTGNRSGTLRALWTYCQNKSDGLLRSANSWKLEIFKQLSVKPELAGSLMSSGCRRRCVLLCWMGVFLDIYCVRDAVPMRSRQFITTRPRPLNCASVIQAFTVLNALFLMKGMACWEFFLSFFHSYLFACNFSKALRIKAPARCVFSGCCTNELCAFLFRDQGFDRTSLLVRFALFSLV